MSNKLGFTLAEVLITMSIIGVVAALTVPNMVNNYQKEAQTVQIRKAINDMTNAVDLLITEEGKTKFSSTSVFTGKLPDGTPVSGIENFINNHFKVAQTTGGFASTYKSISGESSAFSCNGSQFVLANSNALCIKKDANKKNLHIIIDTNAQDKPNISGRDLFAYYIDKDGKISADEDSSEITNEYGYVTGDDGTGNGCTTSTKGKFCLSVLSGNNWKMTY